jgi:hypothetical protein
MCLCCSFVAYVDFAGDGGGDQGGAVFAQALDGALHMGDQGVDLARFAVEMGGDGALFGEGGEEIIVSQPVKRD